MPETPKYIAIRDDITGKVRRGHWRPGDRVPTEQELCALYGVSTITVRQATNELAKAGVLKRVPGKGTFIQAHNPAAMRVAVVLDGVHSHGQGDFDAAILRGVKSVLGNGVHCLLFDEPEVGYLRSGAVDGVILKNPRHDDLRFALLRDLGIAQVVIGSSRDPGVCAVDNDNRLGGKILGRHLLSVGVRRLGFLNGPGDLTVSAHRLEGVREAVAEHPGAALVCFEADGFRREAASKALDMALLAGCDGLITADDQLALGAMDVLRRMNGPRPGAFPVACWNDSPVARSVFPPLTAYDIDPGELGRQAARNLMTLLAGGLPDSRPVPGHLVVRESTVPSSSINPSNLEACP